jgi:hypothetical protein
VTHVCEPAPVAPAAAAAAAAAEEGGRGGGGLPAPAPSVHQAVADDAAMWLGERAGGLPSARWMAAASLQLLHDCCGS